MAELFAPLGPILDQDLLLWSLTIALALDIAFGEPGNDWHPVAHLGAAISWLERLLYDPPPDPMPADYNDTNLTRGWLLLAIVTGGALIIALGIHHGIMLAAGWFSDPRIAEAVIIIGHGIALKPCFALRALVDEGRHQQRLLFRHRVLGDDALRASALEEARERLRHLCSRSTTQLSAEEISEVTISSMAENLCDSFVAPLICYALFGLPGAIVYRAINTLDAMVGYRGRYEFFGRPSAKLDDLANFIPARLTGFLLIGGGWLASLLTPIPAPIAAQAMVQSPSAIDAEQGLAVMLRDNELTPSPNGGWPMAAMAGLLGIQLRKRGVYTLGDRRQPATDRVIGTSLVITAWAAALTILVVVVLSQFLFFFFGGSV